MSSELRLMAVLAHPDDESLGVGGALARYAAEGVATFLITATRGQRGRFKGVPPGDAGHPGPEALAGIREAELRAAVETLGVRELLILDYMDGELDRAEPRAAIARIAHQLRRVRPHVVMTFGPDGAYGHPDHIAISQFTTAAVVVAASAEAGLEDRTLPPHAVSKLYYMADTAEMWEAYQSAFKRLVSVGDRPVRGFARTRADVQSDTVPGGEMRSERPETPDLATTRQSPLAMAPDAFRAAGYRLVDMLAELLASVPTRAVTPGESPSAVRGALGIPGPLPEHGTPAVPLLEETAWRLFEHSLFNGHPRFFGYITSSPAPIGMLADLLAAAVNPNCGAWTLSPAATEIEGETVRWIAELIGYPAECGGLLVSGGNMANLVCFYAARAAKAPWNLREAGGTPPNGGRLRVYVSAEAHTWIQKATDMAGLGTDAIRWIPTDAHLRMDLAALRSRVGDDRAAGDVPFLVVGTAGSVSTGAIDPLPALADFCHEQDLWFHVDGAYGALAAAVEECPPDLRGLSRADSVAVDPHKWLYVPIEAGCALVRDPEHLRAAFSYHPPYYHFEERATNYVDYGPQNSRGFRALKVWLALRHAGAAGYRQMIADDMRLSRAMARAIVAERELELVTQALSIATFRYLPPDLRPRAGQPRVDEYLNQLNTRLLERIQQGGEAFVSNAVIGGRYVLRACIVNFNTGPDDVAAVPAIAVRIGRELDAVLRPRDI